MTTTVANEVEVNVLAEDFAQGVTNVVEQVAATSGVTVYTKNGCMPCKMTLKKMEKAGIKPDNVINMDETPEAVDYIKSLGYMQAPVVVVSETEHWSGLRPDRIEQLKASLA